MCGRYANAASTPDLLETYAAVDATGGVREPDWNAAPTNDEPVVLTRRPRGEPDAEPVRQLRMARWGLVPSWAKDARGGARLINARLETVTEKPAFRRAVQARRCLVPADGWYEWSGQGRDKQAWFLSRTDGAPLAMAGLYELWRDPAVDPVTADPWLWTCTVLTTEATDELGHIHDRAPALVPRERWAAWLDPALTDPVPLLAEVGATDPGLLGARPVGRAVGNVASNGPALLDPPDAPTAQPPARLLL